MSSSRIASLDQFRGFTVAGMIVVNYLGSFALTHAVLKHHNTYFSYADTIMPAFHFAVGYALRLTLLKRIARQGKGPAYLHIVKRCLGLVLLSTVLELSTGGLRYKSWSALQQTGLWGALAGPLKCELWETLAIIGVTSLWVLPVTAAGPWVRIAFLVFSTTLHLLLSGLFYFHFLYARPNSLDAFWGATDVRGLDGGPFGFLAWAVPQLAGSLAYDAVNSNSGKRAALRLFCWSALLMGTGYGLSCLSTYYPRTQPATTNESEIVVAGSPVVPDWSGGTRLSIAVPPFVQPPAQEQRQLNFWLMSKRAVTLPFNLFSTGLCLALFAAFVLIADMGQWRVGLFQTFGRNALATYIIHEVVGNAVGSYAPPDSPLSWVMVTFALYAGITYLFVRHLERNGIYLRL